MFCSSLAHTRELSAMRVVRNDRALANVGAERGGGAVPRGEGRQDDGAGGAFLDPDLFGANRIRLEQAGHSVEKIWHVVDLVDRRRKRDGAECVLV